MINREELTKNQEKIVAKFVIILARQEGWTITEDNALDEDDFNIIRIIRWRNTARSLFDSLLEIATPMHVPKESHDWGGNGDFI